MGNGTLSSGAYCCGGLPVYVLSGAIRCVQSLMMQELMLIRRREGKADILGLFSEMINYWMRR